MTRDMRILKMPILPPAPMVRFGCLQPDADGRWYFPIYVDGIRTGKSYTKASHFITPQEETQI